MKQNKTKQISINKYTYLVPLWFPYLDAINEKNPRVIDEARARKLANDLKRCSYYETCATYGLNVETVFQDGKHASGFGIPFRK